MSIREALDVGFNMETDWNDEQRTYGMSFLTLPVPPLHHRVGRAAHMSLMVAREKLALAVAPWLEPPVLP